MRVLARHRCARGREPGDGAPVREHVRCQPVARLRGEPRADPSGPASSTESVRAQLNGLHHQQQRGDDEVAVECQQGEAHSEGDQVTGLSSASGGIRQPLRASRGPRDAGGGPPWRAGDPQPIPARRRSASRRPTARSRPWPR